MDLLVPCIDDRAIPIAQRKPEFGDFRIALKIFRRSQWTGSSSIQIDCDEGV